MKRLSYKNIIFNVIVAHFLIQNTLLSDQNNRRAFGEVIANRSSSNREKTTPQYQTESSALQALQETQKLLLATKDEQIATRNSEIISLKSQITNLDQQITKLQKELVESQKATQSQSSGQNQEEVTALKADLQAAQINSAKLEREMAEKTEELKKIKETLKNLEEASTKGQAQEVAMATVQKEKTELDTKVKLLTQEKEQANTQLVELRKTVKRNEAKIAELNSSLTKARNIPKAESDDQAQLKITELKTQLSRAQDELKSLQNSLQEKEAELQLSKQSADLSKQIEELNKNQFLINRNEFLKKTVASCEADKKQSAEEIKKLLSQIKQSQSAADELNQSIITEKESLKNEKIRFEKEREENKIQTETLDALRTEINDNLQTLKTMRGQLKNERSALINERKKLYEQITQLGEQIIQQQDTIYALQSGTEESCPNAEQLNQQKADLDTLNSALKYAKQAANSELKKLDAAQDAITQQRESFEKSRITLQEKVKTLEATATSQRTEISLLQQDKKQLTSEINTLKGTIESKMADLQTQIKENKKLKDQITLSQSPTNIKSQTYSLALMVKELQELEEQEEGWIGWGITKVSGRVTGKTTKAQAISEKKEEIINALKALNSSSY